MCINACTGLSTPQRDLLVVTGATGTLGKALCNKFIEMYNPETTTVLAGCRNVDAGDDIYAIYPNVFTFECNFDGVTRPDLPPFYLDCLSEFHSVTLFNNAAVCLKGPITSPIPHVLRRHILNTFIYISLSTGCSKNILSKSILVNTIGPLELSASILDNCRRIDHIKCTVVNISSGDGELSYLHSDIQKRIKKVKNLKELKSLARSLAIFYDQDIEYAFGPTPTYSVSKALLNKGTYLLHREKQHDYEKARILTVCPGNFKSAMSTDYELQDNCVSIEEAVIPIIEMLQRGIVDKDEGRYLYRYGERIFEID